MYKFWFKQEFGDGGAAHVWHPQSRKPKIVSMESAVARCRDDCPFHGNRIILVNSSEFSLKNVEFSELRILSISVRILLKVWSKQEFGHGGVAHVWHRQSRKRKNMYPWDLQRRGVWTIVPSTETAPVEL